MASIIKLKTEITNDKLPIIGYDGNLYNYYVGRYVNEMHNNGFTLSSTQLSAVNTLINNGFEHGWIDFVDYLFPFIGNENNPYAGCIPLIDRRENYKPEILGGSTSTWQNTFKYDSSGNILRYQSSVGVTTSSSYKIILNNITKGFFGGFFAVSKDFRDGLNGRCEAYTYFVSDSNVGIFNDGYFYDPNGTATVSKNSFVRAVRFTVEQDEYTNRKMSGLPDNILSSITNNYCSYLWINKNGDDDNKAYLQICQNGDGSYFRNYGVQNTSEGNNYPECDKIVLGKFTGSGKFQTVLPVLTYAFFNDSFSTEIGDSFVNDVRQFNTTLGRRTEE